MSFDEAITAVSEQYGMKEMDVVTVLSAAVTTPRNLEELCRISRLILAGKDMRITTNFHEGGMTDAKVEMTTRALDGLIAGVRSGRIEKG